MGAAESRHITSPLDPDLKSVRSFILDAISKGLIATLVASILKLIESFHAINAELNRKLAAKNRKRPRNETLQRVQLELAFMPKPANDTGDASPKPKPERANKGPKNPTAHGRPKLPASLPRVPEKIMVPAEKCACPDCGAKAEHISFTPTEKLDMLPAQWIVRLLLRETVASRCEHHYIFTAEKGDEVLDRGILGNEVLVEGLVAHYDEAEPWEQMERRARAEGVPLSANTLAASVGRAIDLFDPIIRYITLQALSSAYTALDGTSIRVLDPDHPLGIRSGALWLIEGAHKYAFFTYAPSGHASHLEKVLEGYRLLSVMCDGSATLNCVERHGGKRGGCNSHGRRGLVEAIRQGDHRALEGLEIFAGIFHVDAESKRSGETIEQRFARRQRDSVPLVEKLRWWIDARLLDVEPKSTLGGAIRYLHNQWERLTEFLRDPLMELTNNEVERDLRRWVLNRKTWFFCGHDESARRAADALTIITTCKKHGIDPRAYVRDTLAKILAGEKDLNELLPESYADRLARQSADAAA